MGGCLCSDGRIEPKELEELDRSASEESVVYKGIRKHRIVTDKCTLGVLLGFILIFTCFVIYVSTIGDIDRILRGHDECGNVCGKRNSRVDEYPCSGKDMTDKPYLVIEGAGWSQKKRCVAHCSVVPNFQQVFDFCLPSGEANELKQIFSQTAGNEFQAIAADLHKCVGEIFGLCILSLVYSALIVMLYRYAAHVVVWFILIGVSVACLSATTFLWIMWFTATVDGDSMNSSVETGNIYLGFAIITSIVTLVTILIIVSCRKSIKLVIQLFKEAGKAIGDMPILVFEPLLTFIAIGIGSFLFLYFLLLCLSAGDLTKSISLQQSLDSLEYTPNRVVIATVGMSLVLYTWLFYFIVDCQHMVIAGSVASWYFTRNKNNLKSPIFTSAYNMIRYHLGTIAFGSLLVTLITILKMVLRRFFKSILGKHISCISCCLQHWLNNCCSNVETFLKYFNKNAYILTAIYGDPFCTAGKRAFELLKANILKVAAINSVGDFVLLLGKIFITVATVIVGFEILRNKDGIHNFGYPLMVVGVFAFFIAHCFLTVFEMAIDTIFLCFCEDYEQNDGLSKPYYMSRELMEFVENSNKVLLVKNADVNEPNWQENVGRSVAIIHT